MDNELAGRIVDIAMKCTEADMIQELSVGGNVKNELLLFIKPEVFLVNDREKMRKCVQLVLDSLQKYNARIDGIYAVNGSVLEKNNIMSKHYGFINAMSNSASKMASEDERKKIEETYGIQKGPYQILGGHEYLKKYPAENVDTLDTEWFKEKSAKVRSGFYTRYMQTDGENVVLVDGFHPKQLAYYTDNTHRIVLMLIHSDTAWSILRNEMIGATFPEKAAPESIRGILYKDPKEYGFDVVTIANNSVHLSAGPFEGMFEISNFFGKITGFDMKTQQPVALKTMLAQGIAYDTAVKASENPQVEKEGKKLDLFTATEDMDTDKAVDLYKGNV